ncbi:uncharacterized protein LOC143424872 [Xylocopa sonorina]|uniref:uncharacterized protein LOC143424872 n=1 Tax=Xylocopa sonorina TaxID=1818115 RepID=UPI00403AD1DC
MTRVKFDGHWSLARLLNSFPIYFSASLKAKLTILRSNLGGTVLRINSHLLKLVVRSSSLLRSISDRYSIIKLTPVCSTKYDPQMLISFVNYFLHIHIWKTIIVSFFNLIFKYNISELTQGQFAVHRMPFAGEWCKVWIYFGFVFAWTKAARPRFDTSTDMGLVLIPADAEVDSVIFRLRATDQDADFPLVFEITGNPTITPVVRIDNLPCTLYNKVCQANVILTKRLVPGRLHDFAVRVRDTKGDSNSMQATISVTNATTPRDKIFPHIPSLIMVPENTKPGKELDYLLVRANPWSGKPVYIELWELFTIRQRQTPTQTRGVIILTGELDFETQSMYTLTMYATDPYTEQGKDTRNIAGLSVVVVVQDVQDVPPIFTLAPPLTRINNSIQPGDIIVRVHAEDGDKGVPREIVYGLVSEGNPFTPFFNISETSGEITLARPLDELTQITHVGAPVVLTVVAEEIRRSRDEPPAQATVVDVGFLLGEPGNSPPYFESDNYVATIDENPEPGTVINFGEQYTTRVKDEDIGKAGVFALKLKNNNGTFEIMPTVAERTADFVITVRDNALIDYELYKMLSFKIVAQEVGPATNLSTSVPVTIFLRDINDNPPVFEEESYEVTLPENVTAGSRVVQVHATDKDTGIYGSIRYTSITGEGSEAFTMDPDTGLITVTMGSSLDREVAARLVLCVEARDEDGNGNAGVVTLIVNLLDVNDNSPIFEKDVYEFMLNSDLTNFTSPAFIKAIDIDAEPPNNVVRYELVHGNYENKFYLNETSGELILRSPITKIRRKKQSTYEKFSKNAGKKLIETPGKVHNTLQSNYVKKNESLIRNEEKVNLENSTKEVMTNITKKRRKRDDDDALYTLTARAYDLGVPHLSSVTKIRILSGIPMEARIMMFVVPGEQPDSKKTAATLAAITGGRVTVLETRPYTQQNLTGSAGGIPVGGQKSIIVARVEQTEPGAPLVDVEKIRETLAANGVGIIANPDVIMNATTHVDNTKPPADGTAIQTNINDSQTTVINNTITTVQNEEVTVYKAENKLLIWLLVILGLLMLLAIAALIICCICPGCPFYMAPRKRRVHSSETLVVRSDGRPKRHLHRQPAAPAEVSWNGRKQAWSADPTTRNWQFNKRNVKNCSLPGDVAYISGKPNDIQMNIEAQRLRDGPFYGHSRRSRMNEHDRMYMEDVEDQKARRYDTAELDSLQRNEMDRGSDLQHQVFRERYMEPDINGETTIREQHFYREGNAEVLRLVTRGQVEDATTSHPHHAHRLHPTTLIVDGKDIILQRFIEDQKSGHELSMQDIEAARSMESHQRFKDVCQQQPQPEIILIPDRLEPGHKQHIEEIGPNVQRLVIDHGDYGSQKMDRESLRQEKEESMATGAVIGDIQSPGIAKQHEQPSNAQYPFHDLELARQNALLTRLLLERESRRVGAGAMDSTSYLETQSLPGQVAIATQTDRTAATQTERYVKSRSDNDESDEDSKQRKKLRSRKRTRTLWMKSPIEEEGGPCFDKRLNILRKKVRQVKEGRKVSLEPDVLREISDSLNGNGSSCKAEEEERTRTYRKSTEQQTSISYKVLNEKDSGSQSSEGVRKDKRRKSCEDVIEDQTTNVTESTSSPEMKIQREKREKMDDKSPKKDATKSRTQQKSDGVAIKPSFKILEKEFTMLTKKLSKLGEKKFQESTCSDSTSQEKSDSFTKKDLDQKSSRKVDTSSYLKEKEGAPGAKAEQKGKQKKESAIARTKQKLKYQQSQVMSTGSSEYDDTLDKPKRTSGIRQESIKQKQSISHAKLKRQKQTGEPSDERIEKRKDGPTKETLKAESKLEKAGKLMTRAPKLAVLYRKPNVTEETSTSTEEKKDGRTMPADFGKKSSTDFSDSSGTQQREMFARKVVQKFSDDFVEEPREEITAAKATTSTEEEQRARMVTKQIIVTEKQSTGDTVLGPKNGLDRIEGKPEERVDIKKVVDDSRLDGVQELVKGSMVISAILTEEKRLSETKDTEKPLKADKSLSPEIESIKEEKPGTRDGKDIKLPRNGEAKSSEEAEIKGKMQKEEMLERTAQMVPHELKMHAATVKPKDDSEEQPKFGEKYEYLMPIEELSKAFEQVTASSDEVKKIEVEKKVEEMSTEREQVNISESIDADKSKVKDETKDELLQTKVPMDEQSNGKMDLIAKIEEPIEKYLKTESLSSDKESGKQITVEEPSIHEKKDEFRESDKEDRRHSERADVSIVDHVFKDKKEDTVKATSDKEEAVPKVMADDYQTEKSIFLGDKTEDVVKVEGDDQTTESTFLDEDKKEFIAESITEDRKMIEETTTDHKIVITKAEDHKPDTETMKDDKFTEDLTKEHGIDKEAAKDYKIVEKPVEGHKMIEEPIKGPKMDEETSIDYKTTEEEIKDRKIIEDVTTDYKIDVEVPKDHKMAEETTEDHKITEEPIKDERIDNGATKDHKIIEEVIEDSKISIETADSVPKEEMVSDREIKTSTEETTGKIDEEVTFLGEEKTISKEETAIESKIDSQLSEEDKPSPSEKEEIDIMPSSQIIEKKSAFSEEKDAILETNGTKEKETTIDDRKINGEQMVFINGEKEVKDLKEEEEIDIKSDKIDDYLIKEKKSFEDEEKKKQQDKKEEMEPVVDYQKIKEETIRDVQKIDDHGMSEKQIVTPTQKNDDERITGHETTSETSKTEEQQATKKLDDVPEIQDQAGPSKVYEANKDDMTLEKDSSSKMLIAEKEDSEAVNISIETPTSAEKDTTKKLSEEPKDNIFSGMFRAVHSLADTLTNGKGSADASTETVTGTTEHPSSDDKSIEKDSHSLLSNGESKPGTEMSSKSQAKEESSELVYQTADSEKLEEHRKTDETIVPMADKLVTSLKDTMEHESQIRVPIEKKKSEEHEKPDEIESSTSVEPVRKEETDGSSRDQLALSSKAIDDETKDSQGIAGGLLAKTSEAIVERGKVVDSETIDELSRTAVKGEPNKASGSSKVTELLETSPQASETTKREKFAFDSVPSGTPTDFTKKSEPETRLELESGAIKLEEVEQFVKQQTFTAEGDKSRAFPEEQSTVESGIRTAVSQEGSDKQDVTVAKMDETLPLEVETEEYADVSLPLFTSIIDTVDISEDSDSSSDISRKTTLTTRPYQTPRHRARQLSDDESRQAMGTIEPRDAEDDEGSLTIKSIEDEDGGPSEKYAARGKVEDASIQEPSSTKLTKPTGSETSKDLLSVQTASYREKLTTTADTESAKGGEEEGTKESSSTTRQSKDTKSESEVKDQKRTSDAQARQSSRLVKADTFKVSDRRTKESEKKKIPPQKKKKSSSGESSEEKTARAHEAAGQSGYRRPKKPPDGQSKQKESEQAKQLRKTDEEPRRKQSVSKSRVEKDKKSSSSGEKHPSPPKSGEIDPTKAQPKYMAWYKKNREEMEKKRAELMATDDEEQLPRWLRRSMKTHKSEAEERRVAGQKTAETTPRTRRKVKPLVNVESEQLKAIVRQGRKLRRAEGGKNEDPPVQIFASSPPAIPQTDPKHRLVQHSEYKYEKSPAPFYLHPPPAPHPSPQLSPEHFEIPQTVEHVRADQEFDSGVAVSLQGGNRLRHQQLLEKKSVFDIAYSEAAPSQLRSDSTTPPS